MEQIKKLQKQHLEILQIVKGILGFFQMEQILNDAFTVRMLLSTLSNKFRTHITAVDEVLTPFSLDHKESEIKSMVKGVIIEMGNIKVMFGDYIQKWVKTTLLYQDNTVFIMETNAIFSALTESISIESKVLVLLIENNCPQKTVSGKYMPNTEGRRIRGEF